MEKTTLVANESDKYLTTSRGI